MSYQSCVNWLKVNIRQAEKDLVKASEDARKSGNEGTVTGVRSITSAKHFLLGLMTAWQVLVDAAWESDNPQVADLLAG